LKASLEEKYPELNIQLIEGKGGVFEVMKDNQLIYSKKALGRFPEHEEIFVQI